MFLLLEACKQLEVFLGLEKSLGLGDLLLDVAPACRDSVDDGTCLGQVQSGHLLEFSQTQNRCGFFISSGGSLWARDHVRLMSRCAGVGHLVWSDWYGEDSGDDGGRLGSKDAMIDGNGVMRDNDVVWRC